MKKLLHEEVYNIYKKENYIMNSIYVNCMNKDTLTCPEGHKIEIRFNNFKTGSRCSICSGNAKLSHEFVFNYYKSYGYILKSTYTNCMITDNLICPLGHDVRIKFNNFKNNNTRCITCSGNEKHSHEDVHNYYSNEKYIMNSIYLNSYTKDSLTCPKGHNIKISFNNFKNHNRRCRQCYLETNKGELHSRYKKDRTRKKRTGYLRFNLNNIKILKDEPLYNEYINSKIEAKDSNYIWNKTSYTVDHIFPRIAFIDNNLDIQYGEVFIKEICNSRDNLRIIHQKENGSKGGNYNQEEFMKWFKNKIKGN